MIDRKRVLGVAVGLFGGILVAACGELQATMTGSPYQAKVAESYSQVFAEMQAIGPAERKVPPVDAEGLSGKIFTGYQGWFSPDGDGSGLDWAHYGLRPKGERERVFRPGVAAVDYWPSTKDVGPTELYPTEFRHRDGRIANVISSLHPDTVDRHFSWMREYGIDGAFLQRFGVSLRNPNSYSARNIVLDNVRRSARAHGRSYAVMYDLSGLRKGDIRRVVMEDWKRLHRDMQVSSESNYMTIDGKPLVSIWGVGFAGEDRDYTLEECEELVDFLQNDPEFGGCSVMLGVPYYWREGYRDSLPAIETHPLFSRVEVLSPWSVGRVRSSRDAEIVAVEIMQADQSWCAERGVRYFPVAFPGFSWGNLKEGAEYDQIPRKKGAFLWSQLEAIARVEVSTVYLAMFDEIDEGTCFLKVEMDPPVGASRFLDYGDVPDDHYLWLAGEGRKLLRGEREVTGTLPRRRDATP